MSKMNRHSGGIRLAAWVLAVIMIFSTTASVAFADAGDEAAKGELGIIWTPCCNFVLNIWV